MSRKETACLAGVFALLVVLRLPALLGPINLSHDATEYIDIARNVARGEGLVLKIRAYFFGDGLTLPYPAVSLRSPLFPLLMGAAYKAMPSDRVFQWFNLFLFLANMGLLLAILRPILPFHLLAFSLALIGLSEPMFLTSIFPWAEQTAIFWLLLGLLLVGRGFHRRWGAAGALMGGFTAFLAALSRPEYLLVGAILPAWLWLQKERRTSIYGAYVAGFLLPLAGVYAWNYFAFGRSFIPGEYLFRSRHYASYFSWETDPGGTAGQFVAGNWLWIILQIARNVVNYSAKLIGWKNLLFLAAAVPSVCIAAARGPKDGVKAALALVPAVFLSGYCLIWAGMDRERYLLAVTTFWLPLCLLEVNRLREQSQKRWFRAACAIAMTVNLPLFLANAVRADVKMLSRPGLGERFYAKENPAWSNPDLPRFAEWVRSHVADNEAVCLENPFLVNYLTGRMAVVLPERMNPSEFMGFLKHYGASYWVDNPVYSKQAPGTGAGLRDALRAVGATDPIRCGSYQIWRVP